MHVERVCVHYCFFVNVSSRSRIRPRIIIFSKVAMPAPDAEACESEEASEASEP